jgi:hypothetical protein
MRNKHLLGAAAAAALFVAPGAAWSQGSDANSTAAASNSANAVPTTAPANLVMGNSSAAAAPAAPAAPDAAAGDAGNPPPVVYKVDRGFPWGILGVIGLIGLLPLFRRRDS